MARIASQEKDFEIPQKSAVGQEKFYPLLFFNLDHLPFPIRDFVVSEIVFALQGIHRIFRKACCRECVV